MSEIAKVNHHLILTTYTEQRVMRLRVAFTGVYWNTNTTVEKPCPVRMIVPTTIVAILRVRVVNIG